MWLRAEEALSRLGSKPQSLYASVSRGRIRAKPDPADSRRSLYSAVDVDRLALRARGRRSSATVAAEAISWGEPVLSSAVSTVSGGRLYYGGVDAAHLAETATLEGQDLDDLFALSQDRIITLASRERKLTITYDDGYPYAQVYSPAGASFCAIEPMTAPTNALVSGDHASVRPGETFSAAFTLAVSIPSRRKQVSV